MPPEFSLVDVSPYLFLAYIFIKELLPIFRYLLEKWLPEKFKRDKTAQERLLELKHHELEQKAEELEIFDRQVTADEQIAKILILMESNQNNIREEFRKDMMRLHSDIGETKQSIYQLRGDIQILIDRNMRVREGDLLPKSKQEKEQ